ncbi:hypothetical protein [Halorubrum laminariae]|uniref:LPXTG cell wall anchor domain-containing protein n=1 Tax=Halorubrum laminariae TaxID=1433523 RepID=A0ABD6C6W6_9EURY|nr:hypothetical protein [Halorubrum laminariae]
MSDKGDEKTSLADWVLLSVLFIAGGVFFVKPVAVTTGAFVEFVEAFPDPSELGQYGSLFALASMLLGGGGLIRKKR